MKKVVLTIGFFDGVHVGHRKLLAEVIKCGRKNQYESVVLTFDRPPQNVPGLLTTIDEKLDILKSIGINRIEVAKFDNEFSDMLPEEFFYKFLVKRFKISKLIVGYDFKFGKYRAGGILLLHKLCKENKISLNEVKPVKYYDAEFNKKVIISSSFIRNMIRDNKIELANDLLCDAYKITGRVIKGRGIGKKLGFPTANIDFCRDKLLPKGVYYVHSIIKDNIYPGVANIGRKPTINTVNNSNFDSGGVRVGFSHNNIVCEVHNIGFQGKLYNRKISVNIQKMIRKEKKYDKISLLKKQIALDVELVNNFIKTGIWKGISIN